MSIIRLGTRGSPLALAQTEAVRAELAVHHPDLARDGGTESVLIKTTGDAILDRPLAEVGGKGLFTKEIDEALLSGRVDVAVHSVKDLPTRLPEGLVLAAVLPREDPRDVLIANGAGTIAAIPSGAVIGTASLRRQAQILHQRRDLTVVPLRGNVQTRLLKVARGTINGTLLALAGLRRLRMAEAERGPLDVIEMLPAVGQGAIGITCRRHDGKTAARLAALDHGPTSQCVAAERAMLDVLDGSCRTPIAGLAEIDADGRLKLSGLVARPDGSALVKTARTDAVDCATDLGRAVGEELLRMAGHGFLMHDIGPTSAKP